MTLKEMMDKIEALFKAEPDVASVGRIDGEDNVLGLEMTDGTEMFITVDPV